jgi:hypothetical protein
MVKVNTTAFAEYEANPTSVPPNAVAYRLAWTAFESVCQVLTLIPPLSALTFCRVGGRHDPIHIPSPEKQSMSL